jgi:hypothetical protein
MKGLLLLILIIMAIESYGQSKPNYDESKVGNYELPNPLFINGKTIKNSKEWEANKAFWIEKFANNVYGKTPKEKVEIQSKVLESKLVFEGKALREIIEISFPQYPSVQKIEMLVYKPTKTLENYNLVMGLSFLGNHSITDETDIPINQHWASEGNLNENNKFTPKSRGIQKHRWPIQLAIENNAILATAYYGDVEPDHPEGWKLGIRSVLGDMNAKENWGAIGAWAWGMSRMLDVLTEKYEINAKNIFLTGHSRIGKAALWAGVQDARFTHFNSNNSGEGGAALYSRNFGETINDLNRSFPHWFAKKFSDFNHQPEKLGIDSHILISLLAPRPIYVASAAEDLWADPKGEFLGLKNAEPVYKLYKVKSDLAFPSVDSPIHGVLSYHIRSGKHDINQYDWQQYFKFMNIYFSKK